MVVTHRRETLYWMLHWCFTTLMTTKATQLKGWRLKKVITLTGRQVGLLNGALCVVTEVVKGEAETRRQS